MKFFALIEDKPFLVQIARPPKNPDLLSNFKKTNGSTYTGASDQFIGLKKGSKPGIYIAVAVRTEYREVEITVEEPNTVGTQTVNDSTEEQEEKIENKEPILQQESAHSVLESDTDCCVNEIDFRKFNFDFDFHRVNPENRNEAWITYVKDKSTWILMNGSDQLKLAHDMGCKCDNKYIIERVLKEFPAFHIYEEYPLQEMDTPDISFLLFLRNEAFSVKQKQILKKFNSRVCLGWNFDDNVKDVAETEVIIQGFLGMCDLVCVFKDLLLHVEQSNSRMQNISD